MEVLRDIFINLLSDAVWALGALAVTASVAYLKNYNS
jgi:hypothetical protein